MRSGSQHWAAASFGCGMDTARAQEEPSIDPTEKQHTLVASNVTTVRGNNNNHGVEQELTAPNLVSACAGIEALRHVAWCFVGLGSPKLNKVCE